MREILAQDKSVVYPKDSSVWQDSVPSFSMSRIIFPQMNFLYIVNQYPKTSESFIRDEVTNLRGIGHRIDIVSLVEAVPDLGVPVEPPNVHYVPGISQVLEMIDPYMVESAKDWGLHLGSCITYLQFHKKGSEQIGHFIKALWVALYVLKLSPNIRAIHAHFATDAASVAFFLSRMTGIPYAVTCHAYDIFCRNSRKQVVERNLREAGLIITISQYNKEFLRDVVTGSDDRIQVVPNGVDTEFFAPKSGLVRNADILQIVSVGRLVAKKGFADLVRALAICQNADCSAVKNLRIIHDGDGLDNECSRELRDLIKLLELDDRVTIEGRLGRAQIRQALCESDLFILLCKTAPNGDRDGMPVAMLEAMSCALPCISTRVSGIPEVIESGETGMLVEPDAPDETACAIQCIEADRMGAVKMGLRAREKIRISHRKDVQASRVAALLTELAESPRITNCRQECMRSGLCHCERRYRKPMKWAT